MTTWQISTGSQVLPAHIWRVSGIQRRRSSQAMDVVTFQVTGPESSLTTTTPFAPLLEVVVFRDGVRWFVGRITSIRRAAAGGAEQLSVELSGPWWYLENLVYQQTWRVFGSGEIHKSHCLLNTFADGTKMGVRLQIADILTWVSTNAVAKFGLAPFQWDPSEFPDALIPVDEVRDITSAEALSKQLRWIPDAVTWWDYSTTPPTFHCKRRASLPVTTMPAAAPIASIEITPRNDLVVPSVVLKYERIDVVNGTRHPGLFVDAYPPASTGSEFGALCATIDLEGWSVSSAEARITTEPFPKTQENWWKWLLKKEPWLGQKGITLVEPVSVGITNTDSAVYPIYDRELVDGQIAEWMGKGASRVTVGVMVHLSISGRGESFESVWRAFSVNVVSTDAVTGTYRQVTDVTDGEAPPIGLAQVLYDALSVVEWEGTLSMVQESVGAPGAPAVGQRLNLTEGRPEWEAMAAMIQEVAENVDAGSTVIRFGPPQHLGPRDLVELLRVNRFRATRTSPLARTGDAGAAGTGIALGNQLPRENSSAGAVARERLKLAWNNTYIDLDAGKAAGHPMTIQEVSICMNGIERKMLILCSEPY